MSTTPESPAPAPAPPDPDKILLWPQVRELVPLSRVSVWHLRRNGDFPAPLRLSPNRVGWRLSEVRAWIEGRQRA